MPKSSIARRRKAMYVQREMLANGYDCWLNKLKGTLHSTVNACSTNMWDTWINDKTFRIPCWRREECMNDKPRVVRWEDDCLKAYKSMSAKGESCHRKGVRIITNKDLNSKFSNK